MTRSRLEIGGSDGNDREHGPSYRWPPDCEKQRPCEYAGCHERESTTREDQSKRTRPYMPCSGHILSANGTSKRKSLAAIRRRHGRIDRIAAFGPSNNLSRAWAKEMRKFSAQMETGRRQLVTMRCVRYPFTEVDPCEDVDKGEMPGLGDLF